MVASYYLVALLLFLQTTNPPATTSPNTGNVVDRLKAVRADKPPNTTALGD
jgi:hypothetical protein